MNRQLALLVVVTLIVLVSGCTTASDTQPSAEPATGSLAISSTPPGSEIYLDGAYRGITPLTIPDVQIGSHTLEVRNPEYTSWSTSVDIQAGSNVSLNATLVPVAVPTTIPTTVPTAIPTPELPSVVGCWKMEFFKGGATHAYLLELQPGGTGELSSGSVSVEITWSYDPHSDVVEFSHPSIRDPAETINYVFDYNESTDTLTDRNNPSIFYVRERC
jgi:hypothetical protein